MVELRKLLDSLRPNGKCCDGEFSTVEVDEGVALGVSRESDDGFSYQQYEGNPLILEYTSCTGSWCRIVSCTPFFMTEYKDVGTNTFRKLWGFYVGEGYTIPQIFNVLPNLLNEIKERDTEQILEFVQKEYDSENTPTDKDRGHLRHLNSTSTYEEVVLAWLNRVEPLGVACIEGENLIP